ncbi:C-terminal binding protein [Pontibacillus yanchengensis]|uniref:C-terminal binding protein n=2 Tax=Pontibacillus yanchengensis TaxID=462910 RepID=A0ACC7VER0_9BACI|nr:C-terminal binding protein [Pontibacillus yanchengensis]MYL32037.1 C-terminal binding protein [Pontibacillus yanchengensis]MYL52615.1 C-terminal binding protein [Pontibacillus yanchengensis]
MTFKVVVTDYEYDTLQPEREVIERAGGELVAYQCKTEDEVIEACKDADGILTQYSQISASVIENMERCKVIARYGIGYDSVDVKTATENGISVCNVTDYCLDEVADHTMALLLSSARKVTQQNQQVKKGTWDFNSAKPISRLRGKVLGLIGFGNIARTVAEKAKVFGLEIVTYDPFLTDEDAIRAGVTSVEWEELFQQADFLSIHVPLNEQTRGLVGKAEFSLMKHTATLVNTARGPIVDEEALVAALENNDFAGAALDVLETEPIRADHPMLKMNQVLLTPHISWYSEESEKELKTKAAQNVMDVLQGKQATYVVNQV